MKDLENKQALHTNDLSWLYSHLHDLRSFVLAIKTKEAVSNSGTKDKI